MKTTHIARKHSSFITCNSSKSKYNFTNEVPKHMFRLKIINNVQKFWLLQSRIKRSWHKKKKNTSFPIEILWRGQKWWITQKIKETPKISLGSPHNRSYMEILIWKQFNPLVLKINTYKTNDMFVITKKSSTIKFGTTKLVIIVLKMCFLQFYVQN
jgi:hypothetical protein